MSELAEAIRELLANRDAEEAKMRRHGASGHVLAAYREATAELRKATAALLAAS